MIMREIDSGQGLARLLAHLTIVLIVASLVIREDHFCNFFLKNKVLFYLGTISYGLYLYHVPVLEIIKAFARQIGYGISPLILFSLTSLITFFVAHFSYKYIEQPIINLKKTLT
jgi:peptidoglycan/LPS O-acetylase OafA/YrhL